LILLLIGDMLVSREEPPGTTAKRSSGAYGDKRRGFVSAYPKQDAAHYELRKKEESSL